VTASTFLSHTRGQASANAGPKIAALALALFLWLYVTSSRSYETTMRLPVTVVELPESLVVVNDIPTSAQVRVFGRGDRLLWLALQKPRVRLSLKGEREGSLTRMLEPADVVLPRESRVEVRQVLSPRVFQVEVDRLVTRTVPVRCLVDGTPAQGYVRVAGTPTLVPDHVRVRGPAGRVAGLKAMPVEPLIIAGAKDTVTAMLQVVVPDIRHLSVDPSHVRVILAVEPLRDVSLENVPVEVEGSSRVSPAVVTVVLTVAESRAAEASVLDSTEVTARVGAETGEATPELTVPGWVVESRTIPPKVAVTAPEG
jgi:YbbR domain-containing protein